MDNIEIGYGMLTFVNQSTLLYQQINSSNGAVLDFMYLIKNQQSTSTPIFYSISPIMIAAMIGATILLFVLIVSVISYCIKQRRSLKSNQDNYQNNEKLVKMEEIGSP